MNTMNTQEISNGSLKEVWKLSLPLMISFLSLFVMIFVDRIFLSFYSTDALNAATSAGTLSWSLILGWSTLASLAEVFVAQYNGAKRYSMLGQPVWQMIWFSVLSIFFFFPMAIWGTPLFYGAPYIGNFEYEYFNCTMFFSPAAVVVAALTAFFVGQGKTSIIKWLALLGNVVNIILDPILIFGIKDIVPSMGVNGACIATGIGITVQAIVLFYLFLKKPNRETYGTGNWHFKLAPFIRCLKIGAPPAVFVFIELLGWSIFYWMMTKITIEHILVSSICQSILLLFVFFGLGLEKGAAIVAGNLIGAKKIDKIRNVLTSGCKLVGLFSLVIFLFLVIYPDFLINLFLKNPQALEGHVNLNGLTTEYLDQIRSTIRTGLVFIALYMIIEDIRWLINGILTAAGDTLFLMIVGTSCVWLFLLLPTYFLVLKPKADIRLAFVIWVVYSLIASLLFYFRFKQGKWKERALIIDTHKPALSEIPNLPISPELND
jgi:multidrug resistance protein, MATE family